MKQKSGLVVAIVLLMLAAPCLTQSAEAAIEAEGTLRGRGFIYLGYVNPVGYVDVSIRVQLMRHTGLYRTRASFEYTVFTEYYDNANRTLRDVEVSGFSVVTGGGVVTATVFGSAMHWDENHSAVSVSFTAVFVDDDGDSVVDIFTISYDGHDDISYDSRPVQGRIALRP